MRVAPLALATALFVACGTGTTSTPTPIAVGVQLADFRIQPATTTLNGSTFTFEVTSSGPTPHNFNIRNESGRIASSMDLSTGESDTVTTTLAPGTYTYYCAFPGHESLGMRGTLTVSP